jgi:hypothetical protein
MRLWISMLAVVLISVSGFAQVATFNEYRYGNLTYDKLTEIIPLDSGELILLGETSDTASGWPDIYIEKIDANGQTIWTNTLGTNFWDEPHSLLPLANGDFLIVGSTMNNTSENYDVFVVRVDSAGSQIWMQTYGAAGSDVGVDIYPASGGGYLIPGFSRPAIFSQPDFFLMRISENGTELGSQTFGGGTNDICHTSAQAANGNILLGGYTHSNGAVSQDLYLVLCDEDGVMLNDFHHFSNEPVIINDIIAVDDGFIVVGGMYFSNPSEIIHPFLLKTNLNAAPEWYQTYSPDQATEAFAVTQNHDGFLLSGYTYSTGQPDGWILQTDADGVELWSQTVGNGGWEELSCVATDANGQTWFGGHSYIDETQLYDHLLVTSSGVLNVDLVPVGLPIVIPANGGTFEFSAQITNLNPATIDFDLWTIAILPNGAEYGPVLNHQNVSLPSGNVYTINPIQNVPAGAPTGSYEYIVRIGSLDEFMYSETSFEFTKASSLIDVISPETSMNGWDVIDQDATISADEIALPTTSTLAAHPNPFNNQTMVSLSLERQTKVTVAVYDILGREVMVLHDGILAGGVHELVLDADTFASGLYFIRAVKRDGSSLTHKILLLQ